MSLTSWTPGSNELVLLAVATRSTVSVTSVSGNGLTWVNVLNIQDGQNQCKLSVWRAMGASPSTGQITATLSGTAVAVVAEATTFTGIDTGGTNGSAAVEASNSANQGATDTATPSVSVTSITNNAMIVGYFTHRSRTLTVGSGYTAISINNQIGTAGDVTTVSGQQKTQATAGSVTVDASLSGVNDWVAIGVAVKPVSTGSQVDKTFTASASFATQVDKTFTASASFITEFVQFTASASFATPVDKTFTASASFAPQRETDFTARASFVATVTADPTHNLFRATFEGNSTTGGLGASSVVGTASVDATSKIKGTYSFTSSTLSSYGRYDFAAQDELFVSFYIISTTTPASAWRFLQLSNTNYGNTDAYRLSWSSAGKLEIRNNGNSNLATGTTTLAANTTYRIGIHYKRRTDTADAVIQVYLAAGDAAFSGTPEVQVTTGEANVPVNRIYIGNCTSTPVQTFYVDEVSVSNQGMPAPITTVNRWDNQFTAAASFVATERKQGKWRWYSDAGSALAAESTAPTLTTAQAEAGVIRLRVTVKNVGAGTLSEALALEYSQDGTYWQEVGSADGTDRPNALFRYTNGADTAGATIGSRVLTDSTTSGKYHEDGVTTESITASGDVEVDFAIRANYPTPGAGYKFRVRQDVHNVTLDTGATQITLTGPSSGTNVVTALTTESVQSRSDNLAGQPKIVHDGTNFWLFYIDPANKANIKYHYWSGTGSWSAASSVTFASGLDLSRGPLSVRYKLLGSTKMIYVQATGADPGVTALAEQPHFKWGTISTTTITWDATTTVHSSLDSSEVTGWSDVTLNDDDTVAWAYGVAYGEGNGVFFRTASADTGTGPGAYTHHIQSTQGTVSGYSKIRIVPTGDDGGGSATFLAVYASNGGLDWAEYTTAGFSYGGEGVAASNAHHLDWEIARLGNYTYLVYRDNRDGGGTWKLKVFNHTTSGWTAATDPGFTGGIDGAGVSLSIDSSNNKLYVVGIFAGAEGTGSQVVKYGVYSYGSGGAGGTWANVGAAISAEAGKISHVQVAPAFVSSKMLVLTEQGDDGLYGTDSQIRFYQLAPATSTTKTFTASASFMAAAVISNTFTATASFVATNDKTFTAKGAFQALDVTAATFTASGSFKATNDTSFTASSQWAAQTDKTFTAAASFQVLHDTQFSAAASFVKTDIDTSFTASASFYKQRDANVDMAASFVTESDSFFSVEAAFIGTYDTNFTARGAFTGVIDTDLTASASFFTQADTTFTASAFFSDGFSYAFQAAASFANANDTSFTALTAFRGTFDNEFQIFASFAPEQEVEFTATASFVASGDISIEMAASFVLADYDITFTATASFAPAVDVDFTATASFVMENVDTSVTMIAAFAKSGDKTFSVRASFKDLDLQSSFTATASFELFSDSPNVTFQPQVNNIVTYQVVLANRAGIIRDIMTKKSFISLDYTRAVNAVTELKLVLPGSYDRYKLEGDGIIAVYRKIGNNPMYLETDTVWFIRKIERTVDESGMKLYTVTAESANSLAGQFIVGYQNKKTLGYTTKQDQAGDMMLAIAKENFGTLAPNTLRRITMVIEDYAEKGVLLYKQFGWRYLTDVFKEICDTSFVLGTPIYWDVISVNAPLGLEFRVYTNQRGRDRRSDTNSPLIVGPRQKSITSFTVLEDYAGEVNYVFVAGPGEEDDRPVTEYEDTNRSRRGPYSHKEGFVDLRDGGSMATFAYEGQQALRAGQPKITYQGKLASVPGAIYGIDWKFGDRLTAQDDEAIGYDCRVNAVHVTVQNNGDEVIDAALRNDE